MIHNTIPLDGMLEDKTYGACPYCGFKEPNRQYTVRGVKYPFTANSKLMSEEYARSNYGITVEWTEIHCCKKCKKQYYTIHQH